MDTKGKIYNQQKAKELVKVEHLILIAGHYEGVDQRVHEQVVDEVISIGGYVLTGGELPAMVVVDSVVRLLPGVLGNEESLAEESYEKEGEIEYPQYTRPAELARRGEGEDAGALMVPEVLLSGNHAAIRHWRKRQAVRRTLERRPDLLAGATLDDEEREILRELVAQRDKGVGL